MGGDYSTIWDKYPELGKLSNLIYNIEKAQRILDEQEKKMKNYEILTLWIIIVILLLFVSFMIYLLMFHNNVTEITGIKCARNSRINIDYPFCSDLNNCIQDCFLIQGGFVKIRYQSVGIGNIKLCYCLTERGIENIW